MTLGIDKLLPLEAILTDERPNSKKQLFQMLSRQAARLTGIDEGEIFNTLLQREQLGSTGVGNGIAIPHGKMSSLKKIQAIFARLDRPVDYNAMDDQPVDIVFLLLAPESAGTDHLKALSRVARVLRKQQLVKQIRSSSDAALIHALLTEEPAKEAAA